MQQKRGLGSFGGFHTRLCSLNLQRPKKFPRRGEENGSIYIGDDLSY